MKFVKYTPNNIPIEEIPIEEIPIKEIPNPKFNFLD